MLSTNVPNVLMVAFVVHGRARSLATLLLPSLHLFLDDIPKRRIMKDAYPEERKP